MTTMIDDENEGVADNLGIRHKGPVLWEIMGLQPPEPPKPHVAVTRVAAPEPEKKIPRKGVYYRGNALVCDLKHMKD